MKTKTPLKKTYSLNNVSTKQDAENKEWNTTVGMCISRIGYCEICGGTWLLQGHHIIWRSRWSRKEAEKWGLVNEDKNTEKNCLIACMLCHYHDKYPESGLPISIERALEIIRVRNKRETQN